MASRLRRVTQGWKGREESEAELGEESVSRGVKERVWGS